jgi:hypothetical protein
VQKRDIKKEENSSNFVFRYLLTSLGREDSFSCWNCGKWLPRLWTETRNSRKTLWIGMTERRRKTKERNEWIKRKMQLNFWLIENAIHIVTFMIICYETAPKYTLQIWAFARQRLSQNCLKQNDSRSIWAFAKQRLAKTHSRYNKC